MRHILIGNGTIWIEIYMHKANSRSWTLAHLCSPRASTPGLITSVRFPFSCRNAADKGRQLVRAPPASLLQSQSFLGDRFGVTAHSQELPGPLMVFPVPSVSCADSLQWAGLTASVGAGDILGWMSETTPLWHFLMWNCTGSGHHTRLSPSSRWSASNHSVKLMPNWTFLQHLEAMTGRLLVTNHFGWQQRGRSRVGRARALVTRSPFNLLGDILRDRSI